METDKHVAEIAKALTNIQATLSELTGWKKDVDTKVETMDTKVDAVDTKVADLHSSIDDLRIKVEQILLHQQDAKHADKVFDEKPPEQKKLGVAHLTPSSQEAASGQFGHRNDHQHRGFGHWWVTTFVQPPVTGAKTTSDPKASSQTFDPSMSSQPAHQFWGSAMPQLDFPQFDGRNPIIWQKKCEAYFDLYAIPSHAWVKFATMNFTGMADFWLQSVDIMVKSISWNDLCLAVSARFERDQFNQLIRQFFHIKQHASVAEYRTF